MENDTPQTNLPQQPQPDLPTPPQLPVSGPGGKPKAKMSIIILALILVIALVFVLAQNHSAKAPASVPAKTAAARAATVQITAQGFEPATLKVKVGTTVTWNNTDNTLHQVASNPYPADNGLRGFVSKGIESGQSYSYTFSRTGDFGYHDQQNPTKLLGQVDVTN